MKIDKSKLHQDLAGIVENIRELKERRGESHQPRWNWKDIRDLEICKANATYLYTVLAHSRGRIHQKKHTLEQQAELLGTNWKMYELAKAA